MESPSPAASIQCSKEIRSAALVSPAVSVPAVAELSLAPPEPPRSSGPFEAPGSGGRQVVAGAGRNWLSQREKLSSFSSRELGCEPCCVSQLSFPAGPCRSQRFCFSEPVCGNRRHVPGLGEELKPHVLLPEPSQADFCAHLCVRDVWRVFVLQGGRSPGDSQSGLQFCRRMEGRAQISLLWLHQSEKIYQC